MIASLRPVWSPQQGCSPARGLVSERKRGEGTWEREEKKRDYQEHRKNRAVEDFRESVEADESPLPVFHSCSHLLLEPGFLHIVENMATQVRWLPEQKRLSQGHQTKGRTTHGLSARATNEWPTKILSQIQRKCYWHVFCAQGSCSDHDTYRIHRVKLKEINDKRNWNQNLKG